MSEAATPPVRVLVVIVNFRTGPLVVECLRSLAEQVPGFPGGARVVVADNASGDDSCAVIAAALAREGWGAWAELRRLERNGGFAWGNNQVIRPAIAAATPPDYVWLLNPDATARPGALATLVDYLDAHPEVGLAGSAILTEDGAVFPSAFRFNSIPGELLRAVRLGPLTRLLARWEVAPPPRREAHAADFLSGASLMIRRQVFDTVGFLDEGYFLYFEEEDLCRRAARAGWARHYVPQAAVVHLQGQATGLTRQASRKPRPGYWFDSRRRYFEKHHGRLYAGLADVNYAAALALWRLRCRVEGKEDPDPPGLLQDLVRHRLEGGGPPRS